MKSALLLLCLFLAQPAFCVTCAELTARAGAGDSASSLSQNDIPSALAGWVNKRANLQEQLLAAAQAPRRGQIQTSLREHDRELLAFFDVYGNTPAHELWNLARDPKLPFTSRMTAWEALGMIGQRASDIAPAILTPFEQWVTEQRARLGHPGTVPPHIRVQPPDDEPRPKLFMRLALNAGPEYASYFVMGRVLLKISKDAVPTLKQLRRFFVGAWESPAEELHYLRGLIQGQVMATLVTSDLPLAEQTLVTLFQKIRETSGDAWISHAAVAASEMDSPRLAKPLLLPHLNDAETALIDRMAQRNLAGEAQLFDAGERDQMIFLVQARRLLVTGSDVVEDELRSRLTSAAGVAFSPVDLARIRVLAYSVLDTDESLGQKIAPGVEAALLEVLLKLRKDIGIVYQPESGATPMAYGSLSELQEYLVSLMEILKPVRWNNPKSLCDATANLSGLPYMSDGFNSRADRVSSVREAWYGP